MYYKVTSLDKAASSFPPGGFSESCDLSRSACSTSPGRVPAPNHAKNVPPAVVADLSVTQGVGGGLQRLAGVLSLHAGTLWKYPSPL